MLRWIVILFIPFLLGAEERWIELHSGPFVVLSAAGERQAREQMNQLEQFRHALAVTLGKDDLHLIWPVRVLTFRNAKEGAQYTSAFGLARDAYVTGSIENHLRDLARLLIDQNTSQVPAFIEQGLIEVFSTLDINGTHITVGAPPPQRTREWARMHLLLCNPDYAGRTRVMISNLQQGSGLAVAYQNAFQKSEAQIEKQVDADLASGANATYSISALALSVRDFNVQNAEADTVKLAEADLLLAAGSPKADAAYTALRGPGAAEGLGILAVKANNKTDAARLFSSAMESGSKRARVYVEAAALETDPANANKELREAIKLNPQWGLPPYKMALLETDLDRKAILLKKAAELDARNIEYWEALAKNETEAARFVEAQKAWGGAERAANTEQERQQIRKVRLQLEGDRAEHEAAEHKRKAEEEARDLQRVKDASMASIHKAEADARRKLNPDGTAAPKATEWWNGPEAGAKVEGLLEKLDCMGSLGRLLVRTGDGKAVQILVGDPGRIAINGGDTMLTCGVQSPPRHIVVLYNPKINKKLSTAGEAVSIEFH